MPGGGSLNPSTHETVDKKMHFVHQDGAAVFKFAVRKMALLCEEILKRNNIKGSEIDAFIPHQANKRIITATADRLSMRPEAVIVNIEEFGNTTAGTIPLAMETARQQGKLKREPGAAGFGRCRIYQWSDAAALGVLRQGLRCQVSGVRKSRSRVSGNHGWILLPLKPNTLDSRLGCELRLGND